MKKPINVNKLTGKRFVISSNGYTFVLMATIGNDTDPNITTLFINPFEIYSTCKVDSNKFDGVFLKDKLPQVWTSDRNYEFTFDSDTNDNSGLIDWEQTRCIVMEIDWNNQLIKSVLAQVGDGTKGRALLPLMKFTKEDAKSLDIFGSAVFLEYLFDLNSYFESMIDQSKAKVIGLKELTPATV